MIASFLFSLGLVALPFTAVPGPAFLSEVQHELSVSFFLSALIAHGFHLVAQTRETRRLYLPSRASGLWHFGFALLVVIGLSFAFNASGIVDTRLQGRWGFEKFASSLAVLAYGFGLAFLAYGVGRDKDWDRLILRPLALGVSICALYALVEVLAWHSEDVAHFYAPLSAFVHAGFPPLAWDGRLRSVAFEAPDFANYAGYVWPWLAAGSVASRGLARGVLSALTALLTLMIVLTDTRTSLVVLAGLTVAFLLFARLPRRGLVIGAVVFGLFLLATAATLFYGDLVRVVAASDRVSNISRLASIHAALSMFAAHPVWGLGLGQFGFHMSDHVPSWGLASWEVQAWIANPRDAWPASYSLYARLAAELGLVGLVVWLSLWLRLAGRLMATTRALWQQTGRKPYAAPALFLGVCAVLLNGVPCDSFRAPMIWIALGLAGRYLDSAQHALAKDTP